MTEILPITPTKQKIIVSNVLAACKDIRKLNQTGYNFIHQCSGFIAHYNIHGFIDNYSQESLKDDILEYQTFNQWRNFHPGDRNYAYMMSKRDVYNAICEGLSK